MSQSERIQNQRNYLRLKIDALARSLGAGCLESFATRFIPLNPRLPSSAMHRDLYGMLEAATRKRGARIAVAAPRGHAKSTILMAYVLWCVCYAREKYIVIISDTADQARGHLTAIKEQLEKNGLLQSVFPECCGPSLSPPWSKDEIVTKNGVRITALGAGMKIRGRKHGEHRPGLIILDDVESEEAVRSQEQRAKTTEWFHSAVAQAGTEQTNFVVIGTVLHPDSFLANLTNLAKSPGWTGGRYRAVIDWADDIQLWEIWRSIYTGMSEHAGVVGPEAACAFFEAHREQMLAGAKVLWPEREGYYALQVLRLRDGHRAFNSEKQNQPMGPEDALFQETDLHYWDDIYPSEAAFLAGMSGRCQAYGACDPSLGKAGRGRDFTAIVTVLKDANNVLYVAHTDIRKRKPSEIIETIIALHQRFNYVQFGIEVNQFQDVLADLLRERSRMAGCEVPILPIHHSTEKLTRLQRIQPFIASGSIRFSRRHATLIDQLLQVPHGSHDDGPDALEMAYHTAFARRTRLSWYDLDTGERTPVT